MEDFIKMLKMLVRTLEDHKLNGTFYEVTVDGIDYEVTIVVKKI